MAEPTANNELMPRLNARVTKTGPLFIVHSVPLVPAHLERLLERVVTNSFGVFVVPSNTQWAVKCRKAGIYVAFESLVTGDLSDGIGDVGSDIVVPLTNSSSMWNAAPRWLLSLETPCWP